MVTIAIVTPWRNHLELVDDYFAAVETGKPDQLIVVDDCSDTPLPFAALRLDEPSGFCTASNAGLALVETDAVLMLNNDVKATAPDWLDRIRAAIEPGVIVGPLRFDDHGDVDGVQFPYVDGWCAAMMTDDARAIGGWPVEYDEAGPAYFSDNAFSFNARMHGLTLRELRPALHHLTGTTGGHGPQFQHALAVNQPLYQRKVREALASL